MSRSKNTTPRDKFLLLNLKLVKDHYSIFFKDSIKLHKWASDYSPTKVPGKKTVKSYSLHNSKGDTTPTSTSVKTHYNTL